MNARVTAALALTLSFVTWDADAHRPRRWGPKPSPHTARQLLDDHQDVFVGRIDTVTTNDDGKATSLSIQVLRRFKGDSGATERVSAQGEGSCHSNLYWYTDHQDSASLLNHPPFWVGGRSNYDGYFVMVFRRPGACRFVTYREDPGGVDTWSSAWNRRNQHHVENLEHIRERDCEGEPPRDPGSPDPSTELVVSGVFTRETPEGRLHFEIDGAHVTHHDAPDLNHALPHGDSIDVDVHGVRPVDVMKVPLVIHTRRAARSGEDGAGPGVYSSSFCRDLHRADLPLHVPGFVPISHHQLTCPSVRSASDVIDDTDVVFVADLRERKSTTAKPLPRHARRVFARRILHGNMKTPLDGAVFVRGRGTAEHHFVNDVLPETGRALIFGKTVVDETGDVVHEYTRCGPSRTLHRDEAIDEVTLLPTRERVFSCPATITDDTLPRRADVIGFGQLASIDRASTPNVATFALDHVYAGADMLRKDGTVRVLVPDEDVHFAYGLGTLLSLKQAPGQRFSLTSCGDQRILLDAPERVADLPRRALADALATTTPPRASCATTPGAPAGAPLATLGALLLTLARRRRAAA